MDNLPYTNDHDVLVSMHTNMKNIQKTLDKIEDNTSNWTKLLEQKADKVEMEQQFASIEKKIEAVVTFKDTLTGKLIGFGAAISVITALITLGIAYFTIK